MASGTDHFSSVAKAYAEARPTYPAALYEWLSSVCSGHDLAWDVGCGNGQASAALTPYFDKVLATDLSADQIAAAAPHPKITYRASEAQQSGLIEGSVDLITIAQALHWFDLEAFYSEVRRVAKPDAIIAVWTYNMFRIDDEAVMAPIMRLYFDIVGPYWPPGRIHPETDYRDLAFPFRRIDTPDFAMTAQWDCEQVLRMMASWSATARYIKANGHDPVPMVADELRAAWGGTKTRTLNWRLSVLAAKVFET